MERLGQGRSGSRVRTYTRIVSVFLLAGFSVALALSTLVFLWVPYEDTGVSFDGNHVAVDAVPPGSPAAQAGLQIGDRFDPKTSFFDRERIGWGLHPANGQTYTFRIIRDGAVHTIKLRAMNESHVSAITPLFATEYAVMLITCVSFAVVGALLVLLRPSPLTWMFFLFCIGNPASKFLGAIDVLSSLPMPLGFVLNIIRTTLMMVGYVAFLSFALRFPNMQARGWRARIEFVLPALLLVVLISDYVGWFTQFYDSPLAWIASAGYIQTPLYIAFEVIAVASLIGMYRGAPAEIKHRLTWVVLGAVLSYSVILFRDVAIAQIATSGYGVWFCIALQSLSALAPLAIAYGVLRHRVIDVRFVVNRAVVYAVVTSVLVGLLATTYWLIGRLLQQTQLAAILQLAVAIAIGISLQRSYKHIETLINRWFFKSVYDAQEHLSRVATTLSSAESAQALETTLATEPVIALSLTAGALFHRRDDGPFERVAAVGWSPSDNRTLAGDDPLVLHLQAERAPLSLTHTRFTEAYLHSKTNDAEEAVPIFSHGNLTAIALYGSHSNGAKIDPLERSALAKLAMPAERAYDLLRARLENVRRLSDMLERLDNVAYDELHYYLAEQALGSIPEAARKALVACAAIPDASRHDVVLATGDEMDAQRLEDLASGSALIRARANGTYAVHPLMRHILLRDFADARRTMLVRCAQGWQQQQSHSRAALLYWEAGIRSAAADELEAHYSNGDVRALVRTDECARLCASMELHEVLHRPNTWLKRSIARVFKDDARSCARDGQLVSEGAHGQIPLATEALLRSWISWMQVHAGELDQATSLNRLPSSLPSAARAFSHLVQADALGRGGKLSECEAALKAANELFVPLDEFAAMQATIRATCIERISGRPQDERSLLDHATQLFGAANSRLALWSTAEGVITAWIYGDDATFRKNAEALRILVDNQSATTLKHFCESACGAFPEPDGAESPRFVAYASLMQASNAEDEPAARRFAERARVAATRARDPFLIVLTCIARAKLHPPGLHDLSDAIDACDRIKSQPLENAVRSIVAGERDTGMLAAFVARWEKARKGSEQAFSIELASCAVTHGTERLQLSERELALAIAIAHRPEPTSAIELAEMLWPDLDEAAGLRAVQTYVHRLRQRLHDHDCIELLAQGYRYRADTTVDLWRIERFIASLSSSPLGRFDTLILSGIAKQLNATRPGFTIGWEWFAPIERRMAGLLRDAEYRIAKEALQSGKLDDALAYAKSIISRDELDEAAWEIIIRCRLVAGDRVGALRDFRQYREIVHRELDEEPSAEITDLITAKL